ncbi:MAG: phosphonate ABC transporter substrate-binding protein [Litorilinea sp.]|nr:MAG: phosphonate ABC transporter substrate-binding protein [Litorilinea sp.]
MSAQTVRPPGWLLRWLVPLLMLGLAGCRAARAEPLPYLDLEVRRPLPMATAEVTPLRVAVAAIISPQGNAESYGALVRYLGQRLGRPAQLIQRKTYAEVNQLLAEQEVDLGLVCTSAYVEGHDHFGMELLAAPVIQGQTVYHSVLIVPAASPAQTLADLRGATFAFPDPMSFSGRVYPTFRLQQVGERPETFFRRTFFTYSHDRAIEAVAEGIADAAAVDSLVLDYALRRQPELAARIRVLHRSEPFAIPPVVVPPGMLPRQKALLQELLLTMHQDPEGRAILQALNIDRFVPIEDVAYDAVRAIYREVRLGEE